MVVVSFDGTTKVLNKSIAEIHNFKTELYNWIHCNGESKNQTDGNTAPMNRVEPEISLAPRD
jgi:hypothetical protein